MNKTLALLVDSTRDGIVVTDSSGRILVANPAFLALVHTVSEDEVRGRAIGDWVGRIDADVATLLAGAHAHGIAHLVRSSLRRRDGVGHRCRHHRRDAGRRRAGVLRLHHPALRRHVATRRPPG